MKSLWLSALVALLAGGCASTNPPSARPGPVGGVGGAPPADAKAAVSQGPAKDRVLIQYRTALTSLRRGKFDEAKSLLDEALLTAGALNPGDKSARKARGYFSEESRKTFRGEPYERVMAYYYRGILYWMDGEPDNARACFRSGQLQDSDSENKEYASDYVLLEYLDGLATQKLAGDGADSMKRALSFAKMAVPPAYPTNSNTLFFIEYGEGPSKYATGEYDEQLRFRPGRSTTREVIIKVANQAVHVGPYDDLTFQATTRGGRVMDHILANKAVFKSTTDTVGNVALIGGAVAATQRGSREVGLGLIAAGLVSKIVSAATTPSADTRAWDNLPQYLSFAALQLPPGQHEATVEFLDGNRRVLPHLTKTIRLTIPNSNKDTVLFVSDKS